MAQRPINTEGKAVRLKQFLSRNECRLYDAANLIYKLLMDEGIGYQDLMEFAETDLREILKQNKNIKLKPVQIGRFINLLRTIPTSTIYQTFQKEKVVIVLSEQEHDEMNKMKEHSLMIKKHKQQIANCMDELNENGIKYKEEINKQSELMVNAIKERHKELTIRLDKMIKDKTVLLSKQLNQLQDDETKINECYKKCEQLVDDISLDSTKRKSEILRTTKSLIADTRIESYNNFNVDATIDIEDIGVVHIVAVGDPDAKNTEAKTAVIVNKFDASQNLPDIPKSIDNNECVESHHPSKYIQQQIKETTAIRNLLSIERDPPIQRVINTGVIPKIIGFMTTNLPNDVNQELWHLLQFEAAWVVTNIAAEASGEYTRFICQHGAIEGFVNLFRTFHSTKPVIADQAIWGLGNIAADGTDLKERIINTGIICDLAKNVANLESKLQKNVVWAISNIFRHNDPFKLTDIKQMVQVLNKLLHTSHDQEFIQHCLWAFHYLSVNQSEGIMPYLVHNTTIIGDCGYLLRREAAKYEAALNQMKPQNKNKAILKMNQEIYRPCLRLIGNVLAEPNNYLTQAVLDAGYLDVIEPWTHHFLPAQRKEILWSFSNILAGSHQQIEALLSKPNLVSFIIESGKDPEFPLKIEAVWCICNALSEATTEQKMLLVERDAIEVLCGILQPINSLTDEQLQVVIEGMDELLSVDQQHGFANFASFVNQFQACHDLNYFKQRQTDQNISKETLNMIDALLKKLELNKEKVVGFAYVG